MACRTYRAQTAQMVDLFLGAGYIDYYLLHSLMGSNVRKYERLGLWDYVANLKRQGKVHHIGFSYHSGPELLDQLLTQHPEVEFVQLQINYEDWENPSVESRANYEVARAHGKQIVVMEPVKGGRLANPPAEARRLLATANPSASAASWAIRFVASLEGILAVLSGMSNVAQMRDNLSYMRDFQPLSDDERTVIRVPANPGRLARHPLHELPLLHRWLSHAHSHSRGVLGHEPTPPRRADRRRACGVRVGRGGPRRRNGLHRLRTVRGCLPAAHPHH